MNPVSETRSYLRERDRVLELVAEAADMLRAEVARPGGPRGAGEHADVDDEICALLVDGLAASFPQDAIRSEELPERPGSSGRAFVIDPHDGTRHFLRGSRDTAISVGLVEEGRLVLGVVCAPNPAPTTGPNGLLVDWCQGAPLRRDGREVAPPADPPQALTADSKVLCSPALRSELRRWNEEVVAPAQLVGCGSPATRAALVAVGEAQGWTTLRTVLHDWDYAGGQALMEAAGGALVGEHGQPIAWRGVAPVERHNRDWFGGASLALAQELSKRYRWALAERRPRRR